MTTKRTGRPVRRPKGLPAFARVTRAREALSKEAESYVKIRKETAKVAATKGNSAPAEWALTHIAAVDDLGKKQRVVASSVDRRQLEPKGSGVQILIGGGWGGQQPAMAARRDVPQLPEAGIDAESE
jgi:hypothetical protein